MSSGLSNVLLLVILSCTFVLPSYGSHGQHETPHPKRYKFLYYISMVGGSHYHIFSTSGKTLVRQGHKVISLVSSSNSHKMQTKDADVFSIVVFNSSYTQQKRTDVMENIGTTLMKGSLNTFWGPLIEGMTGNLTGELNLSEMWVRECDDLLGDSATMKRLRRERFDMLVADDHIPCPPLLAQALDIPFIYICGVSAVPSKHGSWTGLPINPSYIPERVMGLTHQMTFFQRVQNVLAYTFYRFWWKVVFDFNGFDRIKTKYNIKPEISTYESNNQASLYLFHGSFALEFPRPMQPNTIYILMSAGRSSNETIEEDVAKFLDEASNGVALFSLGTHVRFMDREKAQVFADGFATLPHRVLWQTTTALPSGLMVADNTKVVEWLPLSQVMEHANVKVCVFHGGGFSLYEALWAGLPIVGLPLFEDQMDNIVRVEDRGAGLALDITSITPETLSKTIRRVITEPKFRENARRISLILRDLQTSSPPVETAARWILHVTRFGGDHLRPAVQDMNSLQKSLLDVYLFIFAIMALILGVNIFVCYCCCKCVCGMGKDRVKKEQ